jgi:UDP-N-acetylmuramoyl-tripeptide--D-alanyl-D-alanine ligase
VVTDAQVALGQLAQYVVSCLPDLVVFALTGSQGKTGTKDYLAAIMTGVGPTVATAGNFNNEVGVPLTLLRADHETQFLIVEMGARGLGDIAYLSSLARPEFGAVLNVGTAHLGEFGSREAIAQAKGELVEALPAQGSAILNGDDELCLAMASRTAARVITFGARGDVVTRAAVSDSFGRMSFELGYRGEWVSVALQGLGGHQVANACAAAALALAAGVDLPSVAQSLTRARLPSRWRMELTERRDGLAVINDSYNANPSSMAAAIATLAEIGRRSGRRTVAVLGEMRELGDEEVALHREVGSLLAAEGIDRLVTVGELASEILRGAASAPRWRGSGVALAGRDEAIEWVRDNVSAADVVVVKASRGAALEHVASALLTEVETPISPVERDR